MLVLGSLGPRRDQVRELEAARRLGATRDQPILATHVLPGRHPPLEVLADVVQVEVDRGPAPPGDPVLGRRLEHELDGGPVERVAAHELLEQLVDVLDHSQASWLTRASRQPGAGIRRGRRHRPIGQIRPPDRVSGRSLPGPSRDASVATTGVPSGKGPRMPNYLSPGVYVEEVEAGSRPIEGVGTAVAAFVGLAARGTGQPADPRHELEPVHPDVRRLHRGLVPRARRVRLLPQRRRRRVRRARRRRRRDAHAKAELPSAADKDEARLPGRRARGRPRRQRHHDRRPAVLGDGREQLQARRQPGGKAVETFDNLTTGKGKQNVVTVVKAQSKVIAIEEVGTAQRARRRDGHLAVRRRRRRAGPGHRRRLRRQPGRPHRLRRARGRRRGHDAQRPRPHGCLPAGRSSTSRASRRSSSR